MSPSYNDGDHILTFNWGKIKKGKVVVFKLNNRNLIKRIDKISSNLIFISGDNKKESVRLKPIEYIQIVGKVIFKY